MLNNEEIREQARIAIEKMSKEEKEAIIKPNKKFKELEKQILENGYRSLTKEQKKKFRELDYAMADKAYAGGYNVQSEEDELADDISMTRDEIKNMKKNPYKAKMFRDILFTALANLSIVGGAYVSKTAGVDLSVVYSVLGGMSGLFALSFGNHLMKYFKTKKLKELYESKEFQEQEINAEIYNQLMEESRKGRGK